LFISVLWEKGWKEGILWPVSWGYRKIMLESYRRRKHRMEHGFLAEKKRGRLGY